LLVKNLRRFYLYKMQSTCNYLTKMEYAQNTLYWVLNKIIAAVCLQKLYCMRLILLIAFVCSASILWAQKNPVYIKADLGISNIKSNTSKGSLSFAFGIGLETYAPLTKHDDFNIALNPVLSYLNTAYENANGGKVKVNYINFTLPICLVFGDIGSRADDVAFVVGVGPYVGYAVNGKFQLTSIDSYQKISFGNGASDNRKSIDAGITLKSAIKLARLNFGTQYNIGTANLIPKDRITNGSYIKSRSFLVSVSYALKARKK